MLPFVNCYVIRRASVVTTGNQSELFSLHVALYLSALLLCADIEPNPEPTNVELLSKLDLIVNEMRTLHKETIDRLDIISKEVSTRLDVCEASIVAMRHAINNLNKESTVNAAAIKKVAYDLAQVKDDLKLSSSGGSSIVQPLSIGISKAGNSIDTLSVDT